MALGIVAVVLVAAALVIVKEHRDAPERYRIANPALPPESMDDEGGGAKGPFFPSSAQTNVGGTIPSNFFMTSHTCARCHADAKFMAGYKIPKTIIFGPLPKTATGKIQKFVLRDQARAL